MSTFGSLQHRQDPLRYRFHLPVHWRKNRYCPARLGKVLEVEIGYCQRLQRYYCQREYYCIETTKSNVLVMNPKGLPSLLERAAVKLNQQDVQLATYHLSRYIRATV